MFTKSLLIAYFNLNLMHGFCVGRVNKITQLITNYISPMHAVYLIPPGYHNLCTIKGIYSLDIKATYVVILAHAILTYANNM